MPDIQLISPHVTYAEAIKSDYAIRNGLKNIPSDAILETMKITAQNVFEPMRIHFNIPLGITSFYRSIAVNKGIGGSDKSQHCKGEAIDIDGELFGGVTNPEIFYYIRHNVPFDQLIWEFGDKNSPAWVHVSYRQGKLRSEILRAYRNKGAALYVPFDLD